MASSPSTSPTNPYASGCLHKSLPGWNRKRVCNSDDPPNAVEIGLCRQPAIPNTLEIRIFCFNWDSTYFEAFLLQIILSELLDVPVTIESGNADVHVSLYDPLARFEFGSTSDPITTSAFRNAAKYNQDCTLASRLSNDGDEYEPCAHHFPEIWNVDQGWVQTGVTENLLEFPYSLGMVGLEGLYVTKTTAQQEPSVLSYFGMMGDTNRPKLANLFPRPFTWGEYCADVSRTNCKQPDATVQRPPNSLEEANQFYQDNEFLGHFQHTEENNCTANPTTCTGHMAPFPCGWSSYAEAQMHHLNIALKGGGRDPNMPNRGYHYRQLEELTLAAKATGSNLLIEWWTPTQLSELLRGSNAELIKVAFPAPTQECLRNRHSLDDTCAPDRATRVGDPVSVCDEAPTAMRQSVATGLFDYTQWQDEAIRSPAYDVLKRFLVTEFELGEIFQRLKTNNTTPRDATCEWAVQNIDSFLMPFVPRSHPRTIQESTQPVWTWVGISLGVLTVLVILLTAYRTFQHRNKRVIRYAQVEFLWILLFGGLTLAIGAIVVAVPPTDGTCIAGTWLVNTGYTLILVPLIVKVGAINQLNQMSKKMQRVTLKRTSLLGGTALVCTSIVVFLAIWTAADAPSKTIEYELTGATTDFSSYYHIPPKNNTNNTNSSSSSAATEEENTDGFNDKDEQQVRATVVGLSYYCSSESDLWNYIALGWNVILLLCCTVLAVQTRRVRQEFRESTVLGLLIYSHSIMALLVLMTYFLVSSTVMTESTTAKFRSILYSLDTLTTIIIYFVPKLFADLPFFRRSLGIGRDMNSIYTASQITQVPTTLMGSTLMGSQIVPSLPFSDISASPSLPQPIMTTNHRVTPTLRLSVATSDLMNVSIPEDSALSTSEDFRCRDEDLSNDFRRRCSGESGEISHGEFSCEEGKGVISEQIKSDRELIERVVAADGVTDESKEELLQFLSRVEDLRKENALFKQGGKAD